MTLDELPTWLNSLTTGNNAVPADAGFKPPLAGLMQPTTPPKANAPQDAVQRGAERLAERLIKQFGTTSDVRRPRQTSPREAEVALAADGQPLTQHLAHGQAGSSPHDRILEHS